MTTIPKTSDSSELFISHQLPHGVQEILFYIVARFRNTLYPLAVATQAAPSDAHWKPISKAFVVTATKNIHRYLSDPDNQASLRDELAIARSFYENGREPLLAPIGPPGVTHPEDRAIMLAHPTFPQMARVLMSCIQTNGNNAPDEFWTPVPLNTTFSSLNAAMKAVVFDLTNLDRVTCGILVTDPSCVHLLRIGKRLPTTLPRWIEVSDGDDDSLDDGDSAWDLIDTFPSIPLIDQDILEMLWGAADSDAETKVGSTTEDTIFSRTASFEAAFGSQSSIFE
ncbi:hypothetical protein NLG97_g763 [Lecanicillium saksenae]|uniref:Uncharacterized protein n=1 Tax=Lecanicillium saksenae TaxID=468837 RepID=A0ACC1R5P5_9HYPO|nr:hypothetical protein NLG97_g763 [Lecanicillium saksenae]